MPEPQNRKQDDAYRFLMAAVINLAIADLKGTGLKCREKEKDQAMAFILSDTCEAWCMELKIGYERIREKAAGLYQRIIGNETPGKALKRAYSFSGTAKPRETQQRYCPVGFWAFWRRSGRAKNSHFELCLPALRRASPERRVMRILRAVIRLAKLGLF